MSHVMFLAQPHNRSVTGPGNWRAMCRCGGLDGPERCCRAEAVDDHARHIRQITIDQLLAEPITNYGGNT
jgi:hypothetical protein